MDEQGVRRFFGKTNAVVADAEPQFAGIALQFLDVALASLGETVESGKDAHGRIAINLADIGARWNGKDDFLHARTSQRLGSSADEPNSARISS
jgi:hypothetical protein